ncbi:hypothetical protein J2Z21_008868 [Streptomyces griseochromogenes]|uniref:Secreted protein n=1 Tax=Streptomyces griseochromogenes TaxID=68214 RepID=A0A1B1AZ62_9ACTN|nr:hypothetical protein [Streptomyces griseochromogenes]ANP51802.1 hypothetical protein AVL59_21385 [Streptomyces griseochromogenes]MBP2055852.1 hypothetical protein [Streptomyces griseochromogenes]
MNMRRSVTALAATTALAGIASLGLAASAGAVTPAVESGTSHSAVVHPDGYEPSSVKTRGYCKGWVYTKKSNGHWFAKGVMSSRGGGYRWHCEMHIEREHGGGAYTQISDEHLASGETVSTGYYWDDKGYKVRICVANLDWGDQTFYCGKGV